MNKKNKLKRPPFIKYKQVQYVKLLDTLKFVYIIGDTKNLRLKSKQVPLDTIKTTLFKAKIKYLKKCLLKYRKITGVGRGIAAVQVGYHEAFAVIYMPEIKGKLLTIINPKILKESNTKLIYPEICMSAVPLIAPVARPSWIEFEYYNEKAQIHLWNTKAGTKSGRLYNRVFQHEIDHINGIINIDKVNAKELIFHSDPKFYEKAGFQKIR